MRRRIKAILDCAAGAMCITSALVLATQMITDPATSSNPFFWFGFVAFTWGAAELLG